MVHSTYLQKFLTVATTMRTYTLALVGLVVLIVGLTAFISAPFQFPRNYTIAIPEGFTVAQTAQLLEEENIIRSSTFFITLITLFGGDTGVVSGLYSFERPKSIFSVVYRLNTGSVTSEFTRVTIPEGATVREIAGILKDSFPDLDSDEFIVQALPEEGYLFPETYLFAPGVGAEQIIATMRRQFDETIVLLEADIARFGKPISDIVIMASLLEKEARLFETRQTVAGILWDRIEIGMPLQVDAVFGYILNTATFSPTFDQLEIDSPYNTYTNKGLPPGAIANPGFEALKATVTPIKTPYLFYLTGKDGQMHYGRTFEEHLANRRFLR